MNTLRTPRPMSAARIRPITKPSNPSTSSPPTASTRKETVVTVASSACGPGSPWAR